MRAAQRFERGGEADRIVRLARAHGLTPVTLLQSPPRSSSSLRDAPRFVLVHEPTGPESRSEFYGARPPIGRDLLLLSTREWEIWSEGISGRHLRPASPTWGAPLPVVDDDPVESRRRALRQAGELFWRELPSSLHRDATPGTSARVAEGLRELCSRQTLPSRFPAIPSAQADGDAVFTACLGVAHATFAGEIASEEGPALDPSAVPEQPPPNDEALEQLGRVIRSDFPAHFAQEVLALYLLPGPWGTLHQNQLVAVVSNESPLHQAAGLRRRLAAHLGMVPRDLLAGSCLQTTEPLVVSQGMLHGQLRRRLWRRPLRRLALRLESRLLVGADVLYDGFTGTDFVGTDLRAEVAALTTATAAVFQRGTAGEARELLFGAWPRTIALVTGRSPLEPLHAVHEDLASRTDRALARVGSAARSQPWGDPVSLDRGRAAPFLREWGPALIRLQEFAVEVLG